MPVRSLLLALIFIATSLPGGAAAPDAQSGPSLVVGLGVGGFTPSDRPGEMAVTITSPVLISGRLRVRAADLAVSRPIEVPAGSEQTYLLTMPPLTDGTRLRVEVVDAEGDALVSESVTTRSPGGDEIAVGVMGDPDLVDLLGRVRGVISDRPVAAFPVPADVPRSGLEVLDYLVVSTQEGMDAALGWTRAGGRAVIASSLQPDVGALRPTGVEGVARADVGTGVVLMVEDLEGRSAEDWAAILRPAPLDLASSQPGMMGDVPALLQAASEAGDRQVPSIPWLLFAIVGFALMVGPVNFLLLARMGRRDWAWVTVPVLSLLAVVGFWMAGRQRIAGTNLTHASVITAEGSAEARSAVVVAAGVAGQRRVTYPQGTQVYPERSLPGTAPNELRIVDDHTVEVELPQLGFTGIGLHTADPEVELPHLVVEGDRIIVDNAGELGFWGWGAMAGGSSSVADSELAAGSEGEVALPRAGVQEPGLGFIDALINRHELWEDPARNNSLWPLSQLLFTEADENAVYFVGLTEDYEPDVSSSGATDGVPGPTLVMVEAEGGRAGNAAATVVDTGFVNWLDWGAQQVISTDELTVRFQLPESATEVVLTDARRFGGAPVEYQVWDWSVGEFSPIELGEALPPGAVTADGEVYVRLVGANEVGDNPMSPRDLALEWEA